MDELAHQITGSTHLTGTQQTSQSKIASVRTFQSGATRDTDAGKLDYEGFLSPAVLCRFAEYMHKHRQQPDGTQRPSDNWQKGISRDQYMKSLIRHVFQLWLMHRTYLAPGSPASPNREQIEDVQCAVMFNIMGYLYEYLRGR